MLISSRTAKPASITLNVLKSLGQTAFLWLVFLLAIPLAIQWLEDRTFLQAFRFAPGGWRYVAVVLFIACALLGFWSGFTLLVLGNGTPLPFACVRRLVIAGPYRYIRNPMVVLGITQGVMVGVYLGSPPTVLYALTGAAAWNFIARPWEERDLVQRFGEPFERYRREVRCWWPRLTPYDSQ